MDRLTFGSLGRCLSALALAVGSMGFVGCTNSAELGQMSARDAWNKKQQDLQGMRTVHGFAQMLQGADNGEDSQGVADGFGTFAQYQAEELEQAKAGMHSSLPRQALEEMVDEAAQYFVKNVTRRINGEHQMVMVVGGFTASAPATTENNGSQAEAGMEAALRSLAHKLRQNQVLRANFVFIEQESDLARNVLNDTSGDLSDFRNPFGQGPDTSSIVRYHPDDVYLLDGQMHQHSNLGDYSTTLELWVNVTHPRTRQTIISHRFAESYVYHPVHKWISEERDRALAQSGR